MVALVLDIPIGDTGEIGKQLALVAAVAAAMQVFLGPTIHAQIEALQASNLVPARFGGVAAIVTGALYGLGLGFLGVATTSNHGWALPLVGLLGGIMAGTGAILTDQRIDGLAAAKQEKERQMAAEQATAADVAGASGVDEQVAQGPRVVVPVPNGARTPIHVDRPRDP